MGGDISAGRTAEVPTDDELLQAARRGDAAALAGSMCRDVLTLFSKHVEGDIDPSVCATMEAHLAECNHCRDACSIRAAIQTFLNQR